MKLFRKSCLPLLLAGTIVYVALSCSKADEDMPAAQLDPSISIATDHDTVGPGYVVVYRVGVSAPQQAKSVLITNSLGFSKDTTFPAGITDTFFTYRYRVPSIPIGADIVHVFRLSDGKGQSVEKQHTLRVRAVAPHLSHCIDTEIGAQGQSAYGSFYDADSCMVYPIAQGDAHSESIDMVYYYGTTNNATLASPDDEAFGAGPEQVNLGVHHWGTRNATRFKKTTLQPKDYDAQTDLEHIFNATGGNEASMANGLETGNIIAFRTADGKYGLLRISHINAAQSGFLVFDSKIER